ncbi:MAG: 50S ribosomal protein L9 [Chromatiales bacterium]|jgi:large subunit ribosomal protein L9|nr:50S ribosomal protein L9 [Chromatiales bacterium]
MEIILLDKVVSLGQLGDVVNVKPGYARNFLIPHGKAVRASKANREVFEERRVELERQLGERLSTAQKRADAMAGLAVEVAAKAGEGGKLFGSVGPQDIVDAATASGVEIERSEIHMADGPIRQTGDYEVEVRVHHDVICTLTVKVNGGDS